MIFFDSISKSVIWHKFIESETKDNYLEGLNYLLEKGFKILSVTIDGRKGIPGLFELKGIPVQICQFHIQKRVSVLLSKNPRSLAGKELKQINDLFIKNKLTEQELGRTLALYIRRHYSFLIEKNDEGKYKHQRVIKALRTYKRNMKYLFTFQQEKQQNPSTNIPNTTNHIDGGINRKLKELNRNHRGMRIDRRNKLLIKLLYNLKEN